MANIIDAPKAKQMTKELSMHDDVRLDSFYWLNERENPEVIAYLDAENTYYDSNTAHTKDFQTALFEEMKSRIKKDDSSVPYKYNGYWYITRYEKGKDYPVYTRKKETLSAKEELLFDCNEMAKGHAYFNLRGLNVSPDNSLVAFATDTIGRRQYNLYIKNLKTNKILEDKVSNSTGSSTWANDNKTLFYTLQNKTTLRSEAIYKHTIGSNTKDDALVYEEKDDTFGVGVYKTKSKKYLVISSYSTLTTEYQILNADTPNQSFKVFQPRTRGLEYSIAHYGDSFLCGF
jgi:oligopeptidase B